MKTKIFEIVAQNFIVATLIFCAFSWLAQKAGENSAIILYYYGGLITTIYVAGVIFKLAYIWEVGPKNGPAKKNYHISGRILKFFLGISIILLVTSLLSLSYRYDAWLTELWKPLGLVSGLHSFISSVAIVFIFLIFWFIREDYYTSPTYLIYPTDSPNRSEIEQKPE